VSGPVDWLDDGVVVVVGSSLVIVVCTMDCEMVPVIIMRLLNMAIIGMVVLVKHLTVVSLMLGAFVPVHS